METSSALYRAILNFAHSTPGWFQFLAEIWTELGLLVFAGLFLVVWWRSRGDSAASVAVAVLAPLATGVMYVASELLKSFINEDRPCRAVARAAKPLVECPAVGDWSFPSNHSVIAGAAAAGLILAWPRLAVFVAPMAVLMAFSRVFVGVHYPHDVLVGLLFGGIGAAVLVWVSARLAQGAIMWMRASSLGLLVWFAGPGAARRSRSLT
ncbi:phosphatase PAP2 family protein [Streptomyces spiroverticillatus]|uniref:Phosphatase PAP2 family protein n=1 Tax=Streptomyces finlayi TaxID=67296 RepID=A0A918X4W1_9ACTN|nr:phosphatase PAP2 family protein [Streptomyces finlayi]GHA34710.1 phosphatase PAP2 family protein [Streptomyces spiroverticillatus]GHD12213.1 phosphatase PAP2 family protein [Streptomyces finlayi]